MIFINRRDLHCSVESVSKSRDSLHWRTCSIPFSKTIFRGRSKICVQNYPIWLPSICLWHCTYATWAIMWSHHSSWRLKRCFSLLSMPSISICSLSPSTLSIMVSIAQQSKSNWIPNSQNNTRRRPIVSTYLWSSITFWRSCSRGGRWISIRSYYLIFLRISVSGFTIMAWHIWDWLHWHHKNDV